MTGLEWENFEKLDSKEYLVENNQEFLKYFYDKIKNNYSPILDLKEIQQLINEITNFFEFKYPEKLLNRIRYSHEPEKFIDSLQLSKKLNMNQLRCRLSHEQLMFLDCNYDGYIRLNRKQKRLFETSFCSIKVNYDGTIDKYALEQLKEEKFLDDVEGIDKVEDLLGRYIGIETEIDYTELEEHVKNHKNNVAIRNKVLELIMLNILYSKNTHPKNGYIRAKSFMRMFNKEYKLNLNMKRLDEIMKINYSDTAKVKQLLKERRK